MGRAVRLDHGALDAERVLVDRDDGLVRVGLEVPGVHVARRRAQEQGRGHDGPEEELGPALGRRQAHGARARRADEHVRVVVAPAGPRVVAQPLHGPRHLVDVPPLVAVRADAPAVDARHGAHGRRVPAAPAAERELDFGRVGPQGPVHLRVVLEGAPAPHVRRPAAVVLEVVDAPRGELPRVRRLPAPAPGAEGAGEEAPVRVDAELQAQAVDGVDDGAEALRERGRRGHELAARAVELLVPAVVDVQEREAPRREAAGHEALGERDDARPGHAVAAQVVPGVVAHGRQPPDVRRGVGDGRRIEDLRAAAWRREECDGEEHACHWDARGSACSCRACDHCS